MISAGIFINDFSMHDSTRDLVLAGTQESAELKLTLDQVKKHEVWKFADSILLHVLGKRKEQNIRIEASSGLTDEEIEKMDTVSNALNIIKSKI